MVYSRTQPDDSIADCSHDRSVDRAVDRTVEIRHLHTFLAVADALSFSKAAAQLGVSQPPLSRQIKRLEAKLSVQLFDRSRSQVRLTEAGRVFAEGARRIVAQMERTVKEAQLVSAGLVAPLVVGIDGGAIACDQALNLIANYQHQFPDRQIRVEELDARSQLNALHEGEIAFGFIASKQVKALELPPSLESMPVVKANLQAVLPTFHPLATTPEVSLPDITEEDFVLDSHWASYLRAASEKHCQRPFAPRVVQSAQSICLTLSLVSSGKGISVLPVLTDDRLLHSSIICRPIFPAIEVDVMSVVWRCTEDKETILSWLTLLKQTAEQNEKIGLLQSRLDKSEALLRN